jgi:hypothetical protein
MPKNWRSVFPVFVWSEWNIIIWIFNNKGNKGSTGSMGSKVDNKGMVGNNNQIQLLEPIVHQWLDLLRSLSQSLVYRNRIQT